MMSQIIGWDIGGAHVKAVVMQPNTDITAVFQRPCPLWKGINFLERAIQEILQQISGLPVHHAVTMTGELVDCFESREQGVETIVQTLKKLFMGNELFIYAGRQGFVKADQDLRSYYFDIASTNWLASASVAALSQGQGLFIDIGSTTTDILVLADQQVQAIGFTDFERLRSDELIYTGIVRTAVMAVAQSVCFMGSQMGLMAEYFATMADVYRLTGELNESHDQIDTADGAQKTLRASAKRLSRMTGYEFVEAELSIWVQLATHIKNLQKSRISAACERQLSRNLLSTTDYFIGAGVGRFLVKQIAAELGYPYQDYNELMTVGLVTDGIDIADCAPAAAVALLALEKLV